MPYSDINTLRKRGRLSEALSLAEAEYARTPGKLEAIALFWCLNDVIKTVDTEEIPAISSRMRELSTRHDPNNEMLVRAVDYTIHLSSPEGKREKEGWSILEQLKAIPPACTDQRTNLLEQYLAIGSTGPSKLHSRIMAEALKIDKWNSETLTYSSFADKWGLDNLTEDDWARHEAANGFKIPSLAERIITAYIKDIHQGKAYASEAYRSLLAMACEKFPDNLHMQRYDAQITAKDGLIDQAIARYKQLIANAPEKFYFWGDLADIVSDPDLQIGLLSAAITTGVNDEFLVNIRLRMAELLCNRQMYENAATELHLYRCSHNKKGWPLKRRYFNVANRLPKDIVMNDNRPLYNHYRNIAFDFIYSCLPIIFLVKAWEKKDSYNGRAAISWQLRDNNDSYWISPSRFHLDFRTGNGAAFQARVSGGKIVWLRPAEFPTGLSWLKEATGPLTIKKHGDGKIFGFVNNVFVPAHLLYSRSEGSMVTVKAIENGPDRWAALTIE